MRPERILGFHTLLGGGADRPDVGTIAARIDHIEGISQVCISSAWRPNPEELATLAAGGVVVVSTEGVPPPILVTVEPAAAGPDDEAVPL